MTSLAIENKHTYLKMIHFSLQNTFMGKAGQQADRGEPRYLKTRFKKGFRGSTICPIFTTLLLYFARGRQNQPHATFNKSTPKKRTF